MKKQNRIGIVATLIVALLLAGVIRSLAETRRELATSGGRAAGTARRSSLSGMNSYALALLLGGLRGPLVMILWTQSEQQKQEKNLEGFDTRIEWIRLLQPEFDSVHIFQMWNKAYNISVQMASLANKYTTILDALEYGHSVDAERPNNINIVYSIGQIYFDKLGNSYEKAYYRKRVRAETQQHTPKQKLDRDDPAWRRLELDPVLDADGNVLPFYLGKNLGNDDALRDGELPYLKQFEPYKSGVSPFTMAYNYYKRAQDLQTKGKQNHAQLSDSVIHSRPAIALKHWADEEWELGRQQELTAFREVVPPEKIDLEMAAAKFAYQRDPEDPAQIEKAIYSYDRAVEASRAAKAEYEFHLKGEYRANTSLYQSQIEHIEGQIPLLLADRDYLRLRTASAEERPKLVESARQNYHQALRRFAIHILRYYVEGPAQQQVYGPAGTPSIEQLSAMSDEQLNKMLQATFQVMMNAYGGNYRNEDRQEYEMYIARCANRMDRLRD